MVDDILGVVYDVPLPKLVPPVEAAYQLIVPALAVAPKVTVPLPHTELGVVPLIVGIAFTVIVVVALFAVEFDKQLAFDVITT